MPDPDGKAVPQPTMGADGGFKAPAAPGKQMLGQGAATSGVAGGGSIGKHSRTQSLPASRAAPPPAAGDGGSSSGPAMGEAAVRRSTSGGPLDPDARSRLAEARQGSGQPLPPELQGRFESSLGADLSGVRVHADAGAAGAARALGANAFAHGHDVFFAEGKFAPHSAEGQRLLAHEVAHTAQTGPASGEPRISEPGDAVERDAEASADRIMAGQPAQVTAGAPAVIGRDETPRTDLAADMLEVPEFSLTPGGQTTASPAPDGDGEVLILAGRTQFSSTVQLRTGVTIGAGQEIQVGPTQTMVSSQRTGIYRRPSGEVAAEYTTGPGGHAMRDAGPSQRDDGRPVPEPFYWEPSSVTDTARSRSIPWADQPQFVIPGRMGDAVLSETRGQDSFRTALSAKRGGTLIHLRTLEWAAPWAMTVQNGRATGDATTGASTSGAGAAPDTLTGPIPNEASHEWMRFTDVATARAAGWQTLVRYIGDARTQDRPAFQIMAEALLALNPSFTIGIRCDREYSSIGSDAVTLRATGNTSREQRFDMRQGRSESLTFHLLDVFSIEQISGQSRLEIDVTVGGVASSTHGRVPWVYPWATSSEVTVPLDDRDYRNAYKLSGSVTSGT